MDAKTLWAALATAFLLHSSAIAQNWTADYDAAKIAARDGDRAVFLFFTGSDWCGWCKKLDREILSTPAFAAFAGQNLVLVKVDFPHYTPLPPAQANKNRALAENYQIEGFPTIVVLSKDGRIAGRLGYMEGGPAAFLQQMKSLSGITWRTSGSPGTAAPKIVTTEAPAQMFNGATLVGPKRYEDIQLKGIMGPAQRRMVILNDQTFMTGDTGRVKFKGGQVKVTCKEIKTKSVIVLIEGAAQPKEIFLSGS